jgi:hypothetical protein
MDWQRGLKRLRLVGTVSLLFGILSFASVFLTNMLGYTPDTMFQPLFALMGRLGLLLTILGCLVSVAAWILQGFAPVVPPIPIDADPSRRLHREE